MTGKNLKSSSAVRALATGATASSCITLLPSGEGQPLVIKHLGGFAAGGKVTTNAEGRNFEDDHTRVFFQVPMAQMPMARESFRLSCGGLD